MRTGILKKVKHVASGQIIFLAAAGCFFLTLAWPLSLSANIPALQDSTWFVEMDRYTDGAHATIRCETCHGPMQSRSMSHPNPGVADFLKKDFRRTFDYQVCGKCHKTAHDRFLEGEHAKALVKEQTEGKPSKTGYAPKCGDCHSAHYDLSRKSRVQVGKKMTETCGGCHPDHKRSYLANYHGKAAANLEYQKSAYCTDCHGAHTTLSLKQPEEALKACRRCHPGAGPEFADIIIHDSKNTLNLKNAAKQSGFKWVRLMAALSLTLVTAVLVFFYMHTGLLMLRKLHEKLRRHK